MAKVKKTAVVTGVRNVKASKKASKKASRVAGTNATSKANGKSKTSGRSKTTRTPTTTRKPTVPEKTKGRSTSSLKSLSRTRAKAASAAKVRILERAPVVRISVKPLEPQAKCGAGTSVQYLFRVDETVDGRTTTHLVFFDRHGWYCEHGRNCPAVGHVKKRQGHIARAS